jgi:hypothetical protein
VPSHHNAVVRDRKPWDPPGAWVEKVCAENRFGFFSTGRQAAVPSAATPDF